MHLPSIALCSLTALWLAVAAAEPVYEHPVQRGDTLIGLRAQLLDPAVRWQQLQQFNRVPNPRRLRPGSVLRFPQSWLRERPLNAEALRVHGEVQLRRGGQEQALQAGARLQEGDELRSAAHASAALRFADGSQALLRPNASIKIEQMRQRGDDASSTRQRIEIQQGAIDAQVPPRATSHPRRFELRTPVASLAVRGTAFRAQTASGSARLEVLEGSVTAQAAGKPTSQMTGAVPAGMGWHSQSGQEALLPPPALSTPPQRLERLRLQLAWPADQAEGWRLQWWDAAGERLLLEYSLRQARVDEPVSLPDGDYQLRLRARSKTGIEGLDLRWPLALRARPEPPLPLAPEADAQTYETAPQLRWTQPAGIRQFALQVSANADFQPLQLQRAGLTEAALRAELPAGRWFWRIAAIRDDGHQGPWGEAQSLTRLSLPASPEPQLSRDGDALQLRWPASPLVGARYQVQVRARSEQAPWLDTVIAEPQLRLPLLHPGQQQLRLRTLTRDGVPGPWSDEQGFDGKPRSAAGWWLMPLLVGLP